MKALILAVVLLVVAGLALGLYLGWFSFSTQNGTGKAGVTLSVDKDEMEADKEKLIEELPPTTQKTPE